jgi:RNA polymerase sigma-70 factor (ECF subfamily)
MQPNPSPVRNAAEPEFAVLLDAHKPALRRAIALRLDRRVAARVDASDIVQETYAEAVRRLPEYLESRPMPPELWLHWLAREQVLRWHRRHFADKRAVGREVAALPEESSACFVNGLAGGGPSPSKQAAAAETAERLRLALSRLDDDERDLILWKHFEQLSTRDVAQLLGLSEAAASKRYLRALERLRGLLLALGVASAE